MTEQGEDKWRTHVKITDGTSESKNTPTTQPQQPQQQQQNKQQQQANKLTIPQKSNKLLHVYDAEDRTPVIDTSEFTISELFMKDLQNFTLWTTVYVTLKEHSQSLWFKNINHDMKYTIEEGEGWFLIGQAGQIVTAGKQICVPRDNYHMLLNNSVTHCVYRFECPGTLDLREYLGIPQK
jgi:hypothetical protein